MRHPIAKLGAVLGALSTFALPSAAAAQAPVSGGLLYDDASAPTLTPDGSVLASPVGGMLGTVLSFRGTLAGTTSGDMVVLQRLDRRAGWVQATATTVRSDGTFEAAWETDHSGRTTVRAVSAAQTGATAQAAALAPARIVTVYKPAVATWYGPGFYGRRTACGQRMTHRLLGVAHRSLPCGTLVEVYYEGRTVTVPVVDRGPFRRNASWDLTSAVAEAVGMTQTSTIGTVRVASPSGD